MRLQQFETPTVESVVTFVPKTVQKTVTAAGCILLVQQNLCPHCGFLSDYSNWLSQFSEKEEKEEETAIAKSTTHTHTQHKKSFYATKTRTLKFKTEHGQFYCFLLEQKGKVVLHTQPYLFLWTYFSNHHLQQNHSNQNPITDSFVYLHTTYTATR